MNKTELIDTVAAKSKLSKKDSKIAVDAILDTLTETLSKKESIGVTTVNGNYCTVGVI